MHRCVYDAPIPDMTAQTWEGIRSKIAPGERVAQRFQYCLPRLKEEVMDEFFTCLQKANGKNLN